MILIPCTNLLGLARWQVVMNAEPVDILLFVIYFYFIDYIILTISVPCHYLC